MYPYLLRHVSVSRSNQVWALDSTCIPMAKGFVYLTAVIDVASQRVLAHKTATTLEAGHAVEIIEQAFAKFGTPEILNTDQGSQSTASQFANTELRRDCKLSMDGRGTWRDSEFVSTFEPVTFPLSTKETRKYERRLSITLCIDYFHSG